MHTRKAVLVDLNDTWIKHSENPKFDVTMGSFDGQKYVNLLVYIY